MFVGERHKDNMFVGERCSVGTDPCVSMLQKFLKFSSRSPSQRVRYTPPLFPPLLSPLSLPIPSPLSLQLLLLPLVQLTAYCSVLSYHGTLPRYDTKAGDNKSIKKSSIYTRTGDKGTSMVSSSPLYLPLRAMSL